MEEQTCERNGKTIKRDWRKHAISIFAVVFCGVLAVLSVYAACIIAVTGHWPNETALLSPPVRILATGLYGFFAVVLGVSSVMMAYPRFFKNP